MTMELLIITGMSGAGKSAVVDALEDLGFFCADNLPPAIIPTIAQLVSKTDNTKKIATVTDIRAGEKMFNDFFDVLNALDEQKYSYKILFVDAADEVLIRRYKETRRKHPLLDKCDGSVENAIKLERDTLLNLRMRADYIIDTSKSSVTECKQRVNELFLDNPDNAMKIRCMSFGFKYGIPSDADLVFDVRCLPNPFYVPSMKYRTGLEEDVADYIMKSEHSQNTLKKLNDLIDYMVPLYIDEGKSQLVIAIGCTGGRHRSVCFAEMIRNNLLSQGYSVSVKHRDIEK